MRLLVGLYATSLLATTLTGSLKNPDGTGLTGALYLSLSQQASLSASGGCGGPIQVVPTYQVRIAVAAGALVSPPSIYGNDCLLPQTTYYNVRVTDSGGNILYTDKWLITGSSQDIGAIVSVVVTGTTATLGGVGVLLTAPTTDQTVTQPVGTKTNFNKLNVTGTLSMPGVISCDVTGCNFLVANFTSGLTTGSSSNSQIYVGSSGNLFMRVVSGAPTCTSVTSGWFAIRQDVPGILVCLAGTLYRAPLVTP